MRRMYDFGVETSGISREERQLLAWPVSVWTYYIPEDSIKDVNILEHLLLVLIKKGFNNYEEILTSQLNVSKDLYISIFNSCKSKGYFDTRYKTITLSQRAELFLNKYDNPFAVDYEITNNCKKILVIQDGVTGSIIPRFDIEKFPEFYVDFDENEVIRLEKYEEKENKLPSASSINLALKTYAKILNNIRKGIMEPLCVNDNYLSYSKTLKDFTPCSEIAEQNFGDGVRTLADEEKEKRNLEMKNITPVDDNPEYVYAKCYIAIDKNNVDNIKIMSPFGKTLDDWFRSIVSRLIVCDDDFKLLIDTFKEEKTADLKDTVAFGNVKNIRLFDLYPFVCNDPNYADLKKTFENVDKNLTRVKNGEDDSLDLIEKMATSIQVLFRMAFKNNLNLLIHRMQYDDFSLKLQDLVYTYDFFDSKIIDCYDKESIYRNMLGVTKNGGHITGYVSLILINAQENNSGKCFNMLSKLPSLPIDIKEVTETRNTSTHGNEGFSQMKYSIDECVELNEKFERIVTIIMDELM